jgi:menaquinone-dependent protoporphyrinogen oxidase
VSDSVLVTYATRSGSTQEVAEQIVATLREKGVEVSLQPARQVETVEGYSAVILGAPLYIGRWLKDARYFLKRHKASLADLPVAVFALGPLEDTKEQYDGARGQLDKQLAKYPWLEPVEIAMFGGTFDPARLGFPFSLLPAMKNQPVSDIRDWEAIRAWAASLAAKLRSTTVQSEG